MKRSIQKIKNAHKKISRKIRPRDRAEAVQKSISKWMDRSKDFVSTLPTVNELREEFADWHSFEPIGLAEISPA